MPEIRIVKFLDYDYGDLLVLTDDFSIERGWIEPVRPDFSWWMMEEKGVVGFDIDGLEDKRPDLDFLKSLRFRVTAPQFRLFNAGVEDVAATAYSFFVEQGCESLADSFYAQAIKPYEEGLNACDLIQAFKNWSLLYHLCGHAAALYWMGDISVKLGMNEEAIRWLEKYLDFMVDNTWAHCTLGAAHFNLGNRQKARLHWETALCIDARNSCDTGAAELLRQLER